MLFSVIIIFILVISLFLWIFNYKFLEKKEVLGKIITYQHFCARNWNALFISVPFQKEFIVIDEESVPVGTYYNGMRYSLGKTIPLNCMQRRITKSFLVEPSSKLPLRIMNWLSPYENLTKHNIERAYWETVWRNGNSY